MRELARVDADLGQMSGLATRVVLRRAFHVFGDVGYERLAGVSASHIYNLRSSGRTAHSARWSRGRRRRRWGSRSRTACPACCASTPVHQGDRDGTKGVCLINVVDEVTQYEFVGVVAAISERFLVPVLECLLGLFPFVVVGLHPDNGSEYVNHTVAALPDKLHCPRLHQVPTAGWNCSRDGTYEHMSRRRVTVPNRNRPGLLALQRRHAPTALPAA